MMVDLSLLFWSDTTELTKPLNIEFYNKSQNHTLTYILNLADCCKTEKLNSVYQQYLLLSLRFFNVSVLGKK